MQGRALIHSLAAVTTALPGFRPAHCLFIGVSDQELQRFAASPKYSSHFTISSLSHPGSKSIPRVGQTQASAKIETTAVQLVECRDCPSPKGDWGVVAKYVPAPSRHTLHRYARHNRKPGESGAVSPAHRFCSSDECKGRVALPVPFVAPYRRRPPSYERPRAAGTRSSMSDLLLCRTCCRAGELKTDCSVLVSSSSGVWVNMLRLFRHPTMSRRPPSMSL